jgi:hypothetical protein
MRARGCNVGLLCRVATLVVVATTTVPEQSLARASRAAAHHRFHHHLERHAARLPLRLRLPAADDFSNARADDRQVVIATPASVGDDPRTSIDYRLTRQGPVGSVGLLRPGEPRAVPPAYVGPAASLRRGYPEVTAGAKLSYPF